jgi:hypothetical protein
MAAFSDTRYSRMFGQNTVIDLDKFNDLLFAHGFDGWFVNYCRTLPAKAAMSTPRGFKDYLTGLHTGASLVPNTGQWTWESREALGQRLLEQLAGSLFAAELNGELNLGADAKRAMEKLRAGLELDGYLVRDGHLLRAESGVVDVEAEESVIQGLVRSVGLSGPDTIKTFLDRSQEHYDAGRWEDSIHNSRRFLELVLSQAAARHYIAEHGAQLDSDVQSRPDRVRNYLRDAGLISEQEKEALKYNYSLISHTGSHTYLSERDQARLMRFLALVWAQFVLLRLEGFLAAQPTAVGPVVQPSERESTDRDTRS